MIDKRPPSESEVGANFIPPRPPGRGGKGGRGAVFARGARGEPGGAPPTRPDPPTPRPKKDGEGNASGMRGECKGEEKP